MSWGEGGGVRREGRGGGRGGEEGGEGRREGRGGGRGGEEVVREKEG